MQIVAARYANPLTGLPGNVPIQEHMERLLASEQEFVAAYFDLDQFKPYNDVYGFRRGDDMIQRVSSPASCATAATTRSISSATSAATISSCCSRARTGRRAARPCWRADAARDTLFSPEHVAEGGYRSETRRGALAFHALVTLSIGAVLIDPATFHQYQEVARAASDAKRMAKRIDGSSLFIDQRRVPFARRLAGEPADAA